VRLPTGSMIVDPFAGGRVLTYEEVLGRLPVGTTLRRQRSGRVALPVASHRQWISRMIANLQHIFSATGYRADLGAMCEMQQLVHAATP
jgi:regulator of sirC expression with transglutaminase-like and TPR domain